MKYFAKFEKFVPHSIIMPRFMTIGSQMPELDLRGLPPPYKIGCQNTPYNIGEIHYHKENKTNGGKQIEFSAESNHFEKRNQKWE